MNSVKKIILILAAFFMISLYLTPVLLADDTYVVTDNADDVFFGADLTSMEDALDTTSEKPNVDVIKLTYNRADQSSQVSVSLEVKGVIEDRDDLSDANFNDSFLSGSMINYIIWIETTENSYEITYINKNCTVNYEENDYEVSGNTLTVTFDLDDSSETYVSMIGYTMEFDLSELSFFMDVAPDEAFFAASIDAPSTAVSGEEVSFSGELNDFLSISSGPYTYTWNFDDGSGEVTGQDKTHIFENPGTYNVELTIMDGSGNSDTTTTTIIVTAASTPDNGNGGNGETPSDGDEGGSSFLLFVGVVVIIIIIGTVALVFVIRR